MTMWRTMTLCAAALTLGGCTMLSRVVVLPNSHFVPSDATVRELGPARAGFVHGVSLMGIPPLDFETAALDRRVVDQALRQQVGANVLLNYVLVVRQKMFFPFSWGTIEAEGTAGQIIAGAPTAR